MLNYKFNCITIYKIIMENPIDDLIFIQEIAPCKYGKVYLTSKQGFPNYFCTKIIINKNQTIINPFF